MKNLSAFSSIQRKWPAWIAGVFYLAVAAPASAEAASRPCAEDAARLCKDVPKGGGKIANCLREHKDELSPACRDRVAAAKQKARAAKEACHNDAQKFCKDTEPGKGRIAQCLKQHEAELSQDCRKHLGRTGSQK
jgi:hypothetical protein